MRCKFCKKLKKQKQKQNKTIFPIGSFVETDGGYLGWRSGSPDTILKDDHQRTIPKFVSIDQVVSEKILKHFPIGSYVKTMSAYAVILDKSRLK